MTEGLFFLISHQYNPSVSFADSSPYTGEPSAVAGTVQSESFLEPPALLVVFIIQKDLQNSVQDPVTLRIPPSLGSGSGELASLL